MESRILFRQSVRSLRYSSTNKFILRLVEIGEGIELLRFSVEASFFKRFFYLFIYFNRIFASEGIIIVQRKE